MGEAGALATEHRERLRALDLRALTVKLYKRARGWGYTHERTEDFVHGALVLLAAPPAPPPPPCWDHVADPTAWLFTLHAMQNERVIERLKTQRRRTDLDTEGVEELPPPSDPSGDERFLAREDAAEARAQLLSRLSNAPNALAVARLCMAEYELAPREIAARLGWEVTRVYEAMRLIKAAASEIVLARRRVDDGEGADI